MSPRPGLGARGSDEVGAERASVLAVGSAKMPPANAIAMVKANVLISDGCYTLLSFGESS